MNLMVGKFPIIPPFDTRLETADTMAVGESLFYCCWQFLLLLLPSSLPFLQSQLSSFLFSQTVILVFLLLLPYHHWHNAAAATALVLLRQSSSYPVRNGPRETHRTPLIVAAAVVACSVSLRNTQWGTGG